MYAREAPPQGTESTVPQFENDSNSLEIRKEIASIQTLHRASKTSADAGGECAGPGQDCRLDIASP
jgi:hypothetical protein